MSVAAGSGTTYKLRQWPNKRQSLHNLVKVDCCPSEDDESGDKQRVDK